MSSWDPTLLQLIRTCHHIMAFAGGNHSANGSVAYKSGCIYNSAAALSQPHSLIQLNHVAFYLRLLSKSLQRVD